MIGGRPRILIVDDDEDIREIVGMVLEDCGYATATAADGTDALEKLRSDGRPALILLDLRMPTLSGEELMGELRAGAEYARIPVVVMSGDRAARETAAIIGAASCLTKPMDLDELVATVRRFVL